jgi:hypothetical protein
VKPDPRTAFSRPLHWTLIVAAAGFFGWFVLFLAGVHLPPMVWFLASLLALLVAPAAATRLVRRTALRSTGNVLLTIAAITASLPAVAIVVYFVSRSLPPTSGERTAIASAEAFVLRHGYTAAGHPRGLPIVAVDAAERERTTEDRVKSRNGLLKARAFGVVGSGWIGYDVLFEYAHEPPQPGRYFVVYVLRNGDVLKTTGTYPDWYIKRTAP